MLPLNQAADKAVRECMEFKPDESMLIVTDLKRKQIGEALQKAATAISKEITLVEIPISGISGHEPPPEIAEKMMAVDVVLMPTTHSFTHTQATKKAAAAGVRIGTLPSITEEILCRCLDVDVALLKELSDALTAKLTAAKHVRITTERGTDLTFSVAGREAVSSIGIARLEGNITNIPSGEVFIAPVEGTAQGVYVVDGSQTGIGMLDAPLTFTVKDGFVVDIQGGDALTQQLDALGDKNVYNIAEFGIGTNKAAKIIGNVLEDEKVFGTCHIAIGSNAGFGGTVQTKSHLDGIIMKPTFYFDDEKIMDKGMLYEKNVC